MTRKRNNNNLPTFDELIIPTIQALLDLGGSGTTGAFTRDAIKEATRDGAPPIDLIDGELLCDKLKELKLGVDLKMIETIEIKNEWFNNL